MGFTDLFQQFRIRALDREVSTTNLNTKYNKADIRFLQDQVDHLSLMVMAMGELLEDVGFNKEMLEAKIKELDLRDGKADGMFRPKKVCGVCQRESAHRHFTCVYCGHEL